jgi:hypothetical protein
MKNNPHWFWVPAAVITAFGLCSPGGRAEAPPSRYQFPTNDTVLDTQTDLVWQRNDDGTARTWDDAQDYCATLPLSGSGWRVPSAKELLSILDDGRHNPAIDPTAFPTATNGSFWTNDAQVGTGGKWYLYFPYGNLTWAAPTDPQLVRCVR